MSVKCAEVLLLINLLLCVVQNSKTCLPSAAEGERRVSDSQTSCDPPSFKVSVSVGVLRCVCVCVVTGVGRGRPGGGDGDEHHRGSEEGAVEDVRTR